MTWEIYPETMVFGRRHILFDARTLAKPVEDLFSGDALASRGLIIGWARGRGQTCFLRWEGEEWVLRHYRRGGLVAQFLDDFYFGLNPEKTRSWREWYLLSELYAKGLPVPRPIAASAVMEKWGYRADLVTLRIPQSQPLPYHLRQGPFPAELWSAIGTCLRRFHDAGAYHPDLNASNILLDEKESVYVIDFDRGCIRPPGRWQARNLQRLHRSLLKFRKNMPNFHFSPSDWASLQEGYFSAQAVSSR